MDKSPIVLKKFPTLFIKSCRNREWSAKLPPHRKSSMKYREIFTRKKISWNLPVANFLPKKYFNLKLSPKNLQNGLKNYLKIKMIIDQLCQWVPSSITSLASSYPDTDHARIFQASPEIVHIFHAPNLSLPIWWCPSLRAPSWPEFQHQFRPPEESESNPFRVSGGCAGF